MHTTHAEIRAQQRGIPPFIDQILDLYGHEQYDGHGAIILYLDKQSIRQMHRDYGHRPVARMSEWLSAYKIKSVADGRTITIGKRYPNARINRR